MKKLTILCDADDTIENLSAPWIDELNRKYNTTVKQEELKSWDMKKAYPGLSVDEILEPLYRNEFWEKITPIRDSAYYLEKLINDGHKLYIVTASISETFDAKVKKLIEMFPFLCKEQIILAHNKQTIQGDILIDDGVHNLIGGKYRKFLFHRPNNAEFNEYKYDITRVFSWRDIYERINGIAS